MAFGGKVYDRFRLILFEQPRNQRPIIDIALDEHMSRIIFQTCEITEVPGIGELVEIDNGSCFRRDPVEYKISAYKTCASGN